MNQNAGKEIFSQIKFKYSKMEIFDVWLTACLARLDTTSEFYLLLFASEGQRPRNTPGPVSILLFLQMFTEQFR